MNLNPDDPRLTAYLLDELPPEERASVESEIQGSEALYQDAMELHDTACWLKEELRSEPLLVLDPARAQAVEAAIAAHEMPDVPEPAPSAQSADGPAAGLATVAIAWLRRWWPLVATAGAVGILALIWRPGVGWPRSQPRLAQGIPEAVVLPGVPPAAIVTPSVPTDPSSSLDVPPVSDPANQQPPTNPPVATHPRMDLAMMIRYGMIKGVDAATLELMANARSVPSGPPPTYTVPTDAYRASPWGLRERVPGGTGENPFRLAHEAPLSTFGLDVDTASYSLLRRQLSQRALPAPGSLRLEEMINYFPYAYAEPTDGRPIAVHLEIAGCPWNETHRLLRVGLKARGFAGDRRPTANLVFLVDESGSMQPANKLPLLKQSLRLLVEQLRPEDRVAIVTYADFARVVLRPTSGDSKAAILGALDEIAAGGSTNGGDGLATAYDLAVASFTREGVNRVILCSDGDFNVGLTDGPALDSFIAGRARSGVYLTTLGFGMANYRDDRMERLARHGNGNYAYVDTLNEARKVLGEQLEATLVTVAKDVKVQLEFNPETVHSYRLLGYENRHLAARDFNDDRRDAGDLGAGHTVTAFYEIVPKQAEPGIDPLRYRPASATGHAGELLLFKLRYQEPDAGASSRLDLAVKDGGRTYAQASPDFKFAAAVAAFGMILNESPHRGTATLGAVHELAGEALEPDPWGYRRDFRDLVETARALRPAW